MPIEGLSLIPAPKNVMILLAPLPGKGGQPKLHTFIIFFKKVWPFCSSDVIRTSNSQIWQVDIAAYDLNLFENQKLPDDPRAHSFKHKSYQQQQV